MYAHTDSSLLSTIRFASLLFFSLLARQSLSCLVHVKERFSLSRSLAISSIFHSSFAHERLISITRLVSEQQSLALQLLRFSVFRFSFKSATFKTNSVFTYKYFFIFASLQKNCSVSSRTHGFASRALNNFLIFFSSSFSF